MAFCKSINMHDVNYLNIIVISRIIENTFNVEKTQQDVVQELLNWKFQKNLISDVIKKYAKSINNKKVIFDLLIWKHFRIL